MLTSRRSLLVGVAVVVVLALVGAGYLWNRNRATVVFTEADTRPGTVEAFDFDSDPPGTPRGIQVYSGTWAVRAEADAPSGSQVLCQTGAAKYPALALSEKVYGDMVLTAKVKAVSGAEDRAAGLLGRIQDADNHYIGRANALEDNVRLYRYTTGTRTQIASGTGVLTAGKWHELRLEIVGERLKLFLDGRLTTEASDSTFSAGKAGLWTKADSQTCFDDVTIAAK